jgi:hypothetical protein
MVQSAAVGVGHDRETLGLGSVPGRLVGAAIMNTIPLTAVTHLPLSRACAFP